MASKQPAQPEIKPTPADNYNDAYAAQQSELMPEKMKMAKSLLKTMPTFQNIDFNSPDVQAFNSVLDGITTGNAYKEAAKEFNTAAGLRDFGSSYQAARTANLEDKTKTQFAQNKLTALQGGQGIYNNNLANALSLQNFYGGSPQALYSNQIQMPTLNQGGGSGLGSSLASAGLSAGLGAAISSAPTWIPALSTAL